MTSSSLCDFKAKIDAAVGLVPAMAADEKLKAVQFWNLMSEQLQLIVNNSTDMCALATTPDESSKADSTDKDRCLPGNKRTKATDLQEPGEESGCHIELGGEWEVHHAAEYSSHNPSNGSCNKSPCIVKSLDRRNSMYYNATGSNSQRDLKRERNGGRNCSSKSQQSAVGSSSKCFIEYGQSTKHPGSKSMSKKGKKSQQSSYQCDLGDEVVNGMSVVDGRKWTHGKPYGCSECSLKFATKGNLLVHLRSHTGDKPYACDSCKNTFSTKGNLIRHKRVHKGERPWACSVCSSSFTEKKSLKVHMRRHTGERPYKCEFPQCGKSFSQTGVLQTHMALHLEERKHLCEVCGKAFRQRSQLRLHVLRHEGVKKWNCQTCDARFLTKGDLARHSRIHTGERPFSCDLCQKTFTRQQSLNEHSNRHFGLKPYSCTTCGKAFAEMSACYKHIKQHKRQPRNSSALQPNTEEALLDSTGHNSQAHVMELKSTSNFCGGLSRSQSPSITVLVDYKQLQDDIVNEMSDEAIAIDVDFTPINM